MPDLLKRHPASPESRFLLGNWTPSEHLTSVPTVERDLGKRPSAQRFPGGLLTRKRSQVQTLSRPPHIAAAQRPTLTPPRRRPAPQPRDFPATSQQLRDWWPDRPPRRPRLEPASHRAVERWAWPPTLASRPFGRPARRVRRMPPQEARRDAVVGHVRLLVVSQLGGVLLRLPTAWRVAHSRRTHPPGRTLHPRCTALVCVLDLEGTRRGQWDYGKVRCAGSGR
jgi:hypothetical protein